MSASSSKAGQPAAPSQGPVSPAGRGIVDPRLRRIADDPRFQAMVKARASFTWTLTVVMIAVYLAFIFLVAFAHDVMAAKVGGEMSLGIVFGLVTIILAFVLTGIYVAWANRHDELADQLVEESRS